MPETLVRPSSDAPPLLSVTSAPARAGRVVVEVVGRVDAFSAPLLEACLESATGRPDLRLLVVDLAAVTFLGAAGTAVLAQARQRCRRRGARLVVGT